MNKSLTSHSKFLSLVLRHSPETVGISLDEGGWTPITDLIDACNASGNSLNHDLLLKVVHENEKQRFSISEDGLRIRANQGHSVTVDLGLSAKAPPEYLYHGTVDRFINSIKSQGLIPGGRQFVHLSSDTDTARVVGERRGVPKVLTILASQMNRSGLEFYLSANGVWLTEHVPVTYIQFSQTSQT